MILRLNRYAIQRFVVRSPFGLSHDAQDDSQAFVLCACCNGNNGRFVNRPYETTKVSGSIDNGGSKPPLYGVIVKQMMWLPPSDEGGGTR